MLQTETQIDVDSDDDFAPWLKEIKLLDQAVEENEFRDQVMDKINAQHPLVYHIYNLCELCDKKQLAKFNVKMLKEICSYLEIQVKSRDTKMVILDKLNVELSKCHCHQLKPITT